MELAWNPSTERLKQETLKTSVAVVEGNGANGKQQAFVRMCWGNFFVTAFSERDCTRNRATTSDLSQRSPYNLHPIMCALWLLLPR